MTATLPEAERSIVELRPRFEGSNICTWIGFKHVMYLVEEAVLEHLRRSSMVPRVLFEERGICTEIVDSSVRILHALHMDDVARVEVQSETAPGASAQEFAVTMFVDRDGAQVKCLTGKVKVERKDDGSGVNAGKAPGKIGLARTSGTGRGGAAPLDELIGTVVPHDANAFVWKWRIPYFYCHFTDHIQHSGYLRLMEEVVDLFLADRGISIRTMLEGRRWIPVVPNVRVQILAEALMEETIYTVYTVQQIFKDITYSASMDCYVPRNGTLVHTATGSITHGYAVIENRRDWTLVDFDEATATALAGGKRP